MNQDQIQASKDAPPDHEWLLRRLLAELDEAQEEWDDAYESSPLARCCAIDVRRLLMKHDSRIKNGQAYTEDLQKRTE